LAGGAFAPVDVLRLLPLLLLLLARRALPDWLADLRDANLAGRALAVFSLLIAAAAAFISAVLLLG
jgi:hypothetical protein